MKRKNRRKKIYEANLYNSSRNVDEEKRAVLLSLLSVEQIEQLTASGRFYELFPEPNEISNANIAAAPWPMHLKSEPYELD